MQKLELKEFIELREKNCLVIDTRPPADFVQGFIKNSVSIPVDENFIQTLDELSGDEQKIVFVASKNESQQVLNAVRNQGLKVVGIFEGGYEQWKNAGEKIDMLISIESDEFAMDYQFDEFYLLDVRTKESFEKEHVEDSENIPLYDLERLLAELDPLESYYIYGDTPATAVTAGSLFRRYGLERIRVVAGTDKEVLASGVPVFVQKKKDKAVQKFTGSRLDEN